MKILVEYKFNSKPQCDVRGTKKKKNKKKENYILLTEFKSANSIVFSAS